MNIFRKLSLLVLTFTLPALLASCATVVSSPVQRVTFKSLPTGALVKLDGHEKGRTPVTLTLWRHSLPKVRFELAGYEPYELKLSRDINGWIYGNILIGGLAGVAIDCITGAIFEFSDSYFAPMQRPRSKHDDEFSKSKTDSVNVMVVMVNNPQPGWRKIGQMKKLGS